MEQAFAAVRSVVIVVYSSTVVAPNLADVAMVLAEILTQKGHAL